MNRIIISAAISHMRNAREEIEKLPGHCMDQQTKQEIDQVCQSLDSSISHCQELFRTTGTQK